MKKRIFNTIMFGLFFVISIAVVEVYLRYTEISLPSIIINHPKLGRTFKPNAEIMILNEGLYMGRINKYGYTGRAFSPERKKNTLRIALVGDSYVQGHYMSDKYYFGNIMGEKLGNILKQKTSLSQLKNSKSIKTKSSDAANEKPSKTKVEILNFGIAGSDLQRMYIRFKEQVAAFQPDITLFVIGPGDLLSLDRNLGAKCYLENNKLKVNYNFVNSKTYKMKVKYDFIRKFAFYPLIQKYYAIYKSGKSADILLGKLNPFKFKKIKSKLQKEFPSKEKNSYFPVNKAILETLKKLNRSKLELNRMDNTGKTRIIFVLKKKIPSYYNKVLSDLSLETIDLSPLLEKMKANGINPYYWKGSNKTGHWNHEAQYMIGNYLSQYLASHPIKNRSN